MSFFPTAMRRLYNRRVRRTVSFLLVDLVHGMLLQESSCKKITNPLSDCLLSKQAKKTKKTNMRDCDSMNECTSSESWDYQDR